MAVDEAYKSTVESVSKLKAILHTLLRRKSSTLFVLASTRSLRCVGNNPLRPSGTDSVRFDESVEILNEKFAYVYKNFCDFHCYNVFGCLTYLPEKYS